MDTAGHSTTAQTDASQEQLDVPIQSCHREHEAGHAHELESKKGLQYRNGFPYHTQMLHGIGADVPDTMQVELKTNPDTPDAGSVQKAADFVQAFLLGMSCGRHLMPLQPFDPNLDQLACCSIR